MSPIFNRYGEYARSVGKRFKNNLNRKGIRKIMCNNKRTNVSDVFFKRLRP
jgi:hypothetical protein